ncbi:FG-GAP repeat domain-containing protein [Mucilaginibacter pedocola]|uniref:Cytochrome c domain-containing protein n=1 Tax=Mucilaginibacter pedocola TaxID=1792845 RepID=A0A1S9P7P5_9SPHI|nr:VCBS repeat-containing protein [Mucilaginibacter pedocola]OOQ56972.1 hypothetical protein BC343_15640 [Mucilaginibacter pedocola]
MQKLNKPLILSSIIATTAIIITLALGCGDNPSKAPVAETGETLSKKYCVSCHKYPEPALLDRETWAKHVLPAMAPHLGIGVYGDDQYVNAPSAKAMLGYEDWMKIVDFYKTTAPKTLTPAKPPVVPVHDWAGFKLQLPKHANTTPATTTMVAFDTISKQYFTSDRATNSIYQWSPMLKQLTAKQYNSPAVDAYFSKDAKSVEHAAFTFIGSMDAVDVATGSVVDMPLAGGSETPVAVNLPRPMQSLIADFDKDGLPDRLVCSFGHNFGGLFLYKQTATGQYQKTTISSMPGAEQATIGDFNNDGWPDVACLFAQAQEGVWLFLNDKKGGFTTTNLLHFPPVYGSSSFQMVDINNDGKLDILYTCGDNGDFSRVLKPYHGVYIFLNMGGFKYKQAYFYPVNGATKAIATDFNGDGKQDIALIAFFSDLKNNPEEGFTYFEQTGTMQFTPHRLPLSKYGRWICMDVKDVDGNGKPDVVLGNYAIGFMNQGETKALWDTYTPFVVLKNMGK